MLHFFFHFSLFPPSPHFSNLVLTELVRNRYELLWFSEIMLVWQVNRVTVSRVYQINSTI